MKLMLIGDLHSDMWSVSRLIELADLHHVDLMIQLGDWGFMWPETHKMTAFGEGVVSNDSYVELTDLLEAYDKEMWFIDGNHDDHTRLRAIEGDGWLTPRLRYLERGTRFSFDGVTFLAVGGAYSVDKQWRNGPHREHWDGRNQSWWAEEEIYDWEVDSIIAQGRVDILLCHDKPRSTQARSFRKSMSECLPNADRIERIVTACKPKFVFHGHLHERTRQLIDSPGGWMTLVETLDESRAYHPEDNYIIADTDELRSVNLYLRRHPARSSEQVLSDGLLEYVLDA